MEDTKLDCKFMEHHVFQNLIRQYRDQAIFKPGLTN